MTVSHLAKLLEEPPRDVEQHLRHLLRSLKRMDFRPVVIAVSVSLKTGFENRASVPSVMARGSVSLAWRSNKGVITRYVANCGGLFRIVDDVVNHLDYYPKSGGWPLREDGNIVR